jgi:hypothetical protein
MSQKYVPVEVRFHYWLNTMHSSEVAYAEECMDVMRMAIEYVNLLTIDLEEALPPLPFDVSARQGYMIRQTCLDYAIQLEKEIEGQESQ